MFEHILVPTDGSECAAAATDHAAAFADRYGATVHVLSVADARTLEHASHLDRVREERTGLVASVCETLAASGRTVEEAVRSGIPHREIFDYAKEQDIDLIIMGTHGRTGVERYLLGSVTEKVIRLADIPVLTVPASDDETVTDAYADILLPTDGSESAAAAIDVGVDIANAFDARLHALSVVDTMALGVDVRSAEISGELERAAEAALDTVVSRAANASVSAVDTDMEYGHPYHEINAYVDANDVDLVVMGTHGRSGIERYLLGSVTEKIVRTSSVPVMTVREAAAQDS